MMTFIFKWKIVIGSFWREKKRTSLRKQKINKMKCRVWTRKKQGGCISNYFWNSVFYKISPKHSAPVLLGEKHSGLKGNHWIWRHWQIPISHHHKNIAPHYSWVINFYKHNAREAVVSSSTWGYLVNAWRVIGSCPYTTRTWPTEILWICSIGNKTRQWEQAMLSIVDGIMDGL